MRAKVALAISLAAVLAMVPVAGCGEEEGEAALESVEGEPLHLGHVVYNVSITRFLNPEETSDAGYLIGQKPEPPGKTYLAVFVQITNEEEEPHESAESYTVTDASDRHYEPLPSESPYALEIGATVPPEDSLPRADTTAAEGPIQGAMLLYLVDDDVSEERPLELDVEADGETGVVELDI